MISKIHDPSRLQRIGVLRDMRFHAQIITPLGIMSPNYVYIFGLLPAVHLLVPDSLDTEASTKVD